MKKNEIIELDITDIGRGGEGIGRYNGCAFFVKDALPGDRVSAIITRMEKNRGFAKVKKILSPSRDRISPACPVSSRCGGCQIMELDYAAQLRFKQEKVRGDLARIGGLRGFSQDEIIGMRPEDVGCRKGGGCFVPLHFRNKVQFPVGEDKQGRIITGFYAGRTHCIIETASCPVSENIAMEALNAVREFLAENHIPAYDEKSQEGIVRHILIRTGSGTSLMVCPVINAPGLPAGLNSAFVNTLREKFPDIAGICLNINRERTNVILGKKTICLYGSEYIEERIGSLAFRVSALSFFQVNRIQTEKLYSKILEFAALSGSETVWDLYCGTGTISLFLAGSCKKVFGVEISESAVKDARANARLNGIENARFFLGAAEEIFPGKAAEADVVVLDPPRKGCDRALLDAIERVSPKRVVYVSCDSATLARDIKILTEGGMYRLEKVQPVDMFPHTVHVETVVLLSVG